MRSCFVLVEAEIEKLPQIPPALRRAEGIGMPDVAGAGIAVLCAAMAQKGDGVARRQQAQPDYRGARRRVDHVIDLARHEPCREVDMVGVGNYPPGFQPGERPFLPRDHSRGGIIAVAHQQGRVRVIEIVARIGAVPPVGKQLDLARGAGLETHQKPAGDRTAVPLRLRNLDAHQPVDGRHVVLPAAPHDGVAVAHQEAVARIGRRTGVDRSRDAIEGRQRQAVAAVRHVEQQAMIAAPRVFGGQDADIRGEMHEAIAIARSQVDIGDARDSGDGPDRQRNAPCRRVGRSARRHQNPARRRAPVAF